MPVKRSAKEISSGSRGAPENQRALMSITRSAGLPTTTTFLNVSELSGIPNQTGTYTQEEPDVMSSLEEARKNRPGKKAGLNDNTMNYLEAYRYGEELIRKACCGHGMKCGRKLKGAAMQLPESFLCPGLRFFRRSAFLLCR